MGQGGDKKKSQYPFCPLHPSIGASFFSFFFFPNEIVQEHKDINMCGLDWNGTAELSVADGRTTV